MTQEFARGLVDYCSANGCSQSAAIRVALARLSKSSDDPEQQFAALLDVLGLADVDPSTLTSKQIHDAVSALLAIVPPEGDAPAGDPLAAPADAPPTPPFAASKPPAVHLTPAQIQARQAKPAPASKLSKLERDYCAKHKMTEAAFLAKKASSVRHVASAKPARAALSRAVDAPATPAVPRAFTAAEIAWGERNQVPRNELRATLAERASKSTRRA